MSSFDNNESYTTSAVKDELRLRYIDEVKRLSKKFKRPVYLNCLTLAGGHAIDATLMHDAVPDLNIRSVERDEAQFYEMIKNGPVGMASYLGTLDSYITDYVPSLSGVGDPRCDGHFIGANLDFFGPICTRSILSAMKFVADHRFVRPGFSTIMTLTFSLASRQVDSLNHAISRSLYKAPDAPEKFYNLEGGADYVTAALMEANQSLRIRTIHMQEYRNDTDCAWMRYYLFEVAKPDWSTTYPSPTDRLKPNRRGGGYRIGSLYLPGQVTAVDHTHNRQFTPIVLNKRVEDKVLRQVDLLMRRRSLHRDDIALLEYAISGAPQPRSSWNVGKRLYQLIKSTNPLKAELLALLADIRSDWRFPRPDALVLG